MSRITTAMLMETLNGINSKLDAIDKRVATLEGSKSKPTTSNKGKAKECKKHSTNIADYEPKKVNGNYVWGRKTDTIKSRHYMAMQKAYCYAVATNGQCLTSEDAYKAKLEVDFSEKGAYYKAKAEFKSKYPYIKKADR